MKTNNTDIDTDNDGLNDLYELTYGLDVFHNDSGLDFDHDGLTNLDELNFEFDSAPAATDPRSDHPHTP